jgi:hypothetical protein
VGALARTGCSLVEGRISSSKGRRLSHRSDSLGENFVSPNFQYKLVLIWNSIDYINFCKLLDQSESAKCSGHEFSPERICWGIVEGNIKVLF